MTEKFDFFKKRMNRDGSIDLLGFRPYPRYSVLAGQLGKVFLASADTEEELQKEADAKGYAVDVASLNYFSKFLHQEPSVGHQPADFDHYDAGEYWYDDY